MQIATVIATVLPLWESREALVRVLGNALTCSRPDPVRMEVGCAADTLVERQGSATSEPVHMEVGRQRQQQSCCFSACL